MSPGERMVWAAVYAADWSRQVELKRTMGTDVSAEYSIEAAWAAVDDMQQARDGVREGWGEGDEVLTMLDEMLGDD
jgi:hypothetical protein